MVIMGKASQNSYLIKTDTDKISKRSVRGLKKIKKQTVVLELKCVV